MAAIREAICRSTAAGVTYVAAAGNSTVDTSTFIPAAFPEVIAVSALTDLDGEPGGQAGCWLIFLFCDDTLAEYSNFGATVDVTAPGTQIYSDWTGGGYASEMGTSMAAPHVTGVAALILAAHPTFKPADVEDLLKSTGECPNGAFADDDGSGDCVGKGQWGNDPDGIAEPLVNALHAVEGGTPGDRRPVVHITNPTDAATVSGIVPVDRHRHRRHRRDQGRLLRQRRARRHRHRRVERLDDVLGYDRSGRWHVHLDRQTPRTPAAHTAQPLGRGPGGRQQPGRMGHEVRRGRLRPRRLERQRRIWSACRPA